MKRNIKTIVINIQNDIYLNRINNTPTIKKLFKDNLVVGNNILNVNHFNYSEIVRMQGILYTILI
jgi:hypothetical protein